MMIEVGIFLWVLSFVYLIKYLFIFIVELRSKTPKPIKTTKIEQVFIYLAISYIITSIIILLI